MTRRPSGLRSIGSHTLCNFGNTADIARLCRHLYIGSPTGCTSGRGLPIPLYRTCFAKPNKSSSRKPRNSSGWPKPRRLCNNRRVIGTVKKSYSTRFARSMAMHFLSKQYVVLTSSICMWARKTEPAHARVPAPPRAHFSLLFARGAVPAGVLWHSRWLHSFFPCSCSILRNLWLRRRSRTISSPLLSRSSRHANYSGARLNKCW